MENILRVWTKNISNAYVQIFKARVYSDYQKPRNVLERFYKTRRRKQKLRKSTKKAHAFGNTMVSLVSIFLMTLWKKKSVCLFWTVFFSVVFATYTACKTFALSSMLTEHQKKNTARLSRSRAEWARLHYFTGLYSKPSRCGILFQMQRQWVCVK